MDLAASTLGRFTDLDLPGREKTLCHERKEPLPFGSGALSSQ